MPLGIVIILILTVLIIFGFGKKISDGLAVKKSGAVFLFLILTLSYTIRPLYLEGITAYWLTYIILLIYSLKLLFKLKYPLKLVSASYKGTYEECEGRSYGDPNQGFYKTYWQ